MTVQNERLKPIRLLTAAEKEFGISIDTSEQKNWAKGKFCSFCPSQPDDTCSLCETNICAKHSIHGAVVLTSNNQPIVVLGYCRPCLEKLGMVQRL